MPGQEIKAGAEVNWPVVAGVGILGAVAFYLLYSVNNLLGQVESVTITPLSQVEGTITGILHYLNPANWNFSGDATNDGNQ